MSNTETSIKMKAGRCLRFLIQQHYPTQEEFAYDINVDPRTVRRWLSDGIKDIETIQYIANHFGISFIEYFGVTD